MNDFFMMGGYAFYVWTSYGLAMIVFLVNLFGPIQKHKTSLLRAKALRRVSK